MKGKIRMILFTFFMLCLLTGCSAARLEMTGIYFDTIVTIEIWGGSPSVLEHCKELCQTYENLFSNKIPTSEISRINSAQGQPVTVSDETIALLKKGIEYGRLSEGRFDITIAPLSNLWDFQGNEEGILPDEEQIAQSLKHIHYETIQIDGNTVTMTDPQSQIDVGGIAKGYIADRLKQYLEKEGVTHGLINLGGNVLALGDKPDGTPFHIGIQKPFGEQNDPITTVDISDCSVVSSGIYERYFEKDGKQYHHILNPETGYPYENNLLQVTILSESSVDGDALSTCCFALGLEEGSRLIESLDGVQAIFVTRDYQLHMAGNPGK